MKINHRLLHEFHMKVLSFDYQTCSVDLELFQSQNSVFPSLLKPYIKPKQMELKAEFESKEDISNFMAEILLHKENLLDIEDGYLYHCYFSGTTPSVEETWADRCYATFLFLVIQSKPERRHVLDKTSNLIEIQGNWRVDCTYEILPNGEGLLHLDGHVFRNLKRTKKLIVDGYSKTVKDDQGNNRFLDCTFYRNEFPKVDPGIQELCMDSTVAKVIFRYSPLYI